MKFINQFIDKDYMIYNVIECPRCRQIQSTTSMKRLVCKFCKKSKKISDLRIFYRTTEPQNAINYIKAKKREKFFKKNDEIWIN